MNYDKDDRPSAPRCNGDCARARVLAARINRLRRELLDLKIEIDRILVAATTIDLDDMVPR